MIAMIPRRMAVSIAAIGVVIAAGVTLLPRTEAPGRLRFEKFEGFLGLGFMDDDSATEAFKEQFPIGTPLDEVRDFFVEIGGKCFLLPLDHPGELTCVYGHRRYPLLPIATTWMAIVSFDENGDTMTAVEITGYLEGP